MKYGACIPISQNHKLWVLKLDCMMRIAGARVSFLSYVLQLMFLIRLLGFIFCHNLDSEMNKNGQIGISLLTYRLGVREYVGNRA